METAQLAIDHALVVKTNSAQVISNDYRLLNKPCSQDETANRDLSEQVMMPRGLKRDRLFYYYYTIQS